FVLFGNRAPVALLNLGGIANLTLIPKADAESVIAFDTGPANILSDLIAQRDGKRFDEAGGGAARGRVDERALGWAFSNEYFGKRAPKSTGREDFGQPFADELARRVTRNGGTRDDALATAIALTARTVADGLKRETPGGTTWRELILAGGGARNPTLFNALRAAVAPTPVRTSDELGIPVTAREAVAFAILAPTACRENRTSSPERPAHRVRSRAERSTNPDDRTARRGHRRRRLEDPRVRCGSRRGRRWAWRRRRRESALVARPGRVHRRRACRVARR